MNSNMSSLIPVEVMKPTQEVDGSGESDGLDLDGLLYDDSIIQFRTAHNALPYALCKMGSTLPVMFHAP